MLERSWNWAAASRKRLWAIAILLAVPGAYLAYELAFAAGSWAA